MRSAKFVSINLLDFVRGFSVTKSSVGKRRIGEKCVLHTSCVFFERLNVSIYCSVNFVIKEHLVSEKLVCP